MTWDSVDQDGSDRGIYGQRYDSDGNAVGNEFQINTHTVNHQWHPSVTALSNGGFMVTWGSVDQDGSGEGIYGRMYDSDGKAAGDEFRVNSQTNNDQEASSVTGLSDGGFVVTWQSDGQDGSGYGVYGQKYDSDGIAAGNEFQVNTQTNNAQDAPSITALSDGGFVVTWQSDGQDGSDFGVYGQKYDSDGITAGNEFRINTYTDNDQADPSITGLSDGGFVVTWQSYGQDGSNFGVYGQRYDSDGNTVGDEFQVNTSTDNDQWHSSVTALSEGGFVVTWDFNNMDQDNPVTGIYGQRYDSNGQAAGDEFQANTDTDGAVVENSITALSGGGFVVTWDSNRNDGNGWDVYGQMFSISGAGNTPGGTGSGAGTMASISTVSSAKEAMTLVDNAISINQSNRAQLGALQNRLSYSVSELQNHIENIQAAESVISDADMADEMSEYTKSSVLSQAATAMLAQANMAPRLILSLFQ